MRLFTSLAVLFAALPLQGELVPKKARAKIAAAAGEVAKLGDSALLDEVVEVLAKAGESPEQIESLKTKRWKRALEKAKTPPRSKTRKSVARRVEAAVKSLEQELEAAGEPEANTALAELVLALDSRSRAAHEALGHVEVDGVYLDEEAARIVERLRAVETAIRQATALDVEVTHVSPSPSKLVREIVGEDSHAVSAQGFVLHGGVSPDRLKRALQQGLRALAFSKWLQGGKVELPVIRPAFGLFYTDDLEQYERTWRYAKEAGLLAKDSYEFTNGLELGGFPSEGDVYAFRWSPENKISADLIWYGAHQILPWTVQPFLFAGHTNWLCLRFLGTSKPDTLWSDKRDAKERSTTKPRSDSEAIWRAASSGLFGARSYLKRKLEERGSISVADSLVDQEGKLSGVSLLTATIATEYLQLVSDWSKLITSTMEGGELRTRAVERALAQTLPEFDGKWNAYLLGSFGQGGVLQRVLGGSAIDEVTRDPIGEKTLEHLKEIREGAFAALEVWTEDLALYPELSANARKHAAYLQLNEAQKSAWPDAHEEYADCEGFSPEGAWAGGHSVIAFDGDPVLAVDAWMATFYHRLPLLEPGLCGIGVAVDEDVVVLDSSSLLNRYTGKTHVCWPHASQTGVPLAFRPELPNPVPGEDQGQWGYPITVQSYWGADGQDASVELELFIDGQDEPVKCHFISPSSAFSKRLRPKDAYCLIPKERLSARTTYRVVATSPELGESFSWTFKTGSKAY